MVQTIIIEKALMESLLFLSVIATRRYNISPLGGLGCSHDQCLMTNCGLTKSRSQFFSSGQYLLADSAFSATVYTVTAFKRPQNNNLTDEQHDFNRHLSGVRVIIENCIALLKNRFQSLKGLRLRVSTKKDLTRITCWITVCNLHII